MSLLCLLLFLLIYYYYSYYYYYYYYPGRPRPLGSTSRQHSADGLPSAAEMFHYVQINNIHQMVQQMHFMMIEYENERLMDEHLDFRLGVARRDQERDRERDGRAAAPATATRSSRSRSRSR